ncbi:putative transporter YcgH [Weizmannia acidilactici]|uniref:Transporter YcgH n=1 Tax=Weizmannia acidilactici TaxID=2607726 RepID=A0A5J4JK42_9BACI|nr:amino acid permease [Weizmannia acidilactici]GER68075.1 putative transporter YcgH [Weizmannia acidilactici]GER70918.1 putative transporter YcgH [Weizmannia acidilactici]GER73967.1 putative transporter YcgH [Weizmannia acidilactici]
MGNSKQPSKAAKKGNLAWWQLSLVGVGCTIGTGYFLGSGIGIKTTGPSIVFSFLIAAIGTYIVFHALAKMTADDPREGSFCYYAKKAYGNWAGFSCGWNYWCSNILIMGSQLTALSILTKFWFQNAPLWVMAAVYASLAIIVVLFGTKGFDKVENILAVVKTAAIVMFIVLAFCALSGWINGRHGGGVRLPDTYGEFLPHGLMGFWASLIYAFYAFGGIEVIGLMAMQLKNKDDAPKSGSIMLVLLTIIYVLSLGLTVTMEPYTAFNDKESPFVKAMDDYHLTFFPHVFNGAIIIAGFSTMTASLFGVTNLLVTLSDDGDAPKLFEKKIKKWKNLPLPSLALATAGLVLSIITALLLPGKIYEYITTAAGILLLMNWLFIILSAMRVLKMKGSDKIMGYIGMVVLLLSISGTLAEKEIRPGFYASLIVMIFIIAIAILVNRKKNRRQADSPALE